LPYNKAARISQNVVLARFPSQENSANFVISVPVFIKEKRACPIISDFKGLKKKSKRYGFF